MSKLHELLAVHKNTTAQAAKTCADLKNTFDKKRHLFESKLTTFTPSDEGAQTVTEAQSDIQTTMKKELAWIAGILANAMDVAHQIDVANATAKATIVLEDGTVVAADVPATSLLQLEKELKDVRDLLLAIPTLDPAKGFASDASRGVYQAREVRKSRTKKVQRPLVMYPATPEHPAQTQLITEDVAVGTILEQEWSALLTPSAKGDLIERAEMLLRAVKKARARANEQDIDVHQHNIGKRLLDYVLAPIA